VAGAGVGALEPDSGALVAVGSSALLQPANNANATKPVAICFIFHSSALLFVLGLFTRIISKEIHANTRND